MAGVSLCFLIAQFFAHCADFTVEDFKQTKLEAEKGDVEAQAALGTMYSLGEGTPQNYVEALKWYRRAAEKGNLGAQNNLALVFLDGKGVARNPIEAAKWMQLAANRGLPRAQLNLGRLYLEGIGVGRNAPEAVKWFRRAANQGYAQAQRMLGQICAEGQLAPADAIEAYKWFSLAAAQGDSEAKEARDLISGNLNDRQVADGQRRAAAFVPRPEPGGAMEPKISGTGFFVTSDGYFVTCLHVVDSATRVTIKTKMVRWATEVVRTDKTNDLALLKVTGAASSPSATNNYTAARSPSPRPGNPVRPGATNSANLLKPANGFQPIALTDSASVRLGDPVFTLGFPNTGVQGQEPKLTRGEINSLRGIKDSPRYFQISAPVQPGNSGGPLFNNAGNVVGIVAMSLNDLTFLRATGSVPQNVNYAVKSAHLIEFLEAVPGLKNRLQSPRTPAGDGNTTGWISEVQDSIGLVQVY